MWDLVVLNSAWGRSQSCPTRARTPAPQCGTGVIARQIAENGLVLGTLQGGQITELPAENTALAFRVCLLSLNTAME